MRIGRLLALISIAALLAACGSPPQSAGHHGHKPSSATKVAPAPTGGTGTSTGSSGASPSPVASGTTPAQTPQITGPHRVVNGCDPTMIDPAGPFGMCLDGLPHFYCCSSAATGWSGVIAGMDVDIKGAVPIDPETGKPQSSAVLLLGPNGWREAIPVAASGAFDQQVTFPTAGVYQIGVQYRGAPANLQAFPVAWRWDVRQGTSVADVFPSESGYFPQGDVLLLQEIGRPATFTIRLETAQGVPQPGADLAIGAWHPFKQEPPLANAQGDVTFTLPKTDWIVSAGQVEPGLLLMSYADIRPQGDTLVGFPTWQGPTALPTKEPFSIRQNGVRYYDLADFLARAAGGNSFGPGMAAAYAYDASNDVVALTNEMSRAQARILRSTGAVQKATVSGFYHPITTWTTVGTVKTLMQGDQAYLVMPDLVTVAGALGWAAPDGSGGMYFTFPWVP